ncbi:hypothetical protein FB446DRAFT_798154 [Lentinula raphanica]|nr:hypothetical protein FB446DRAFT_798154 [Lentinula raphanica]
MSNKIKFSLEAKLVQPFRTSSLGNTRYISTNEFIADHSKRGLGSQICDEICKVKGTFDIRLDPMLNQAACMGAGRRNDDEGSAKDKFYVYASHVPVTPFKGSRL